jgi:hypothetical protein
MVSGTGCDGPIKLWMMRRIYAAVAELTVDFDVWFVPFVHTFMRLREVDKDLFDKPTTLSLAGSLLLAESLEKFCGVPLVSKA